MSKIQSYSTRLGKVDLETRVVKIDDAKYRAAGEYNGVVIVEFGPTEIAAFGAWYRAVQLEAKDRNKT